MEKRNKSLIRKKIKLIFDENNNKWYLQTWFICLCFAFWFFVIPLFIGIYLLIKFYILNYKNNIKKNALNNTTKSVLQNQVENNLNCEKNFGNSIPKSNINLKPALEKTDNYNLKETPAKFESSITIGKTTRSDSLYKKTKINTFVENYVVFDIETTGFSAQDFNIIEISALKIEQGSIIDTFNYLVNPNEHIPTKITKLTGITDEMVEKASTIKDVLPKFIAFIENYTLVTFNGSFDFSFIEKNLNRYHLSYFNNSNIDVLYLAKKYIPDMENYKLETLKKHFNLEYKSHRGLEDCYTTNYIYQYCKQNSLLNKE